MDGADLSKIITIPAHCPVPVSEMRCGAGRWWKQEYI